MIGRDSNIWIEAEHAVLGAILRWPDTLDEIIDIIPESSYLGDKRHRVIYDCILALHRDNKAPNSILVGALLEDKGKLKEIGGRSYLVELINGVVGKTQVKYYAEHVVRYHKLRTAKKSICDLQKQLSDGCLADDSDIISMVVNHLQRTIDDITEFRKPGLITFKSILPDTLERLDKINRGEIELGIDTHLPVLNSYIRFLPGQLTILAGRTSTGKTALALNIAEHIALARREAVMIISLEMSAMELLERVIFSQARVNSNKLKNQEFNQDEWTRIIEVSNRIAESGDNFIIDDSAANTPAQICAKIRKTFRRHDPPPALIIVDYLQLITPDVQSGSREQEVASITRSLKRIAGEFSVPILAVSQLNREIEKRSGKGRLPRLSDLRESGAIEQDAHCVLAIHHPQNKKTSGVVTVRICVLKNRNGSKGSVKAAWLAEYTRFDSMSSRRDDATN